MEVKNNLKYKQMIEINKIENYLFKELEKQREEINNNHNIIIRDFFLIQKVIRSCKNILQLDNCQNLVDNFIIKNGLSIETHVLAKVLRRDIFKESEKYVENFI